VDETREGFRLFEALASGLVRLEERLGRGTWMVRPPDMHEEANQHESDQEELVKQQGRCHDEVPFHGDERRQLYRIYPLLNYPLDAGTPPEHVARFSLDLLATHYDPRLAQLYRGLRSALSHVAQTYQALQQGAAWLRDIAYILEPTTTQALRGEQVAEQLRGYLDTMLHLPHVTPALSEFRLHLDKVSRSYWPGLFHCYDVPGLPRTNNALESRFRDTRRRLLRTTGQKGLTQRTLQRQGAWELLPRPPTEAQVLDAVCHTPPEDLAQERQRFAAHRQRFRLQSRSRRQVQAQFDHLRQKWSALQPTGTG
jgi:hypothetical protein